MAHVVLTPEAANQADALPRLVRTRLLGSLLPRLEKWPNVSGAKKLRGKLAGHYRLRTGDYRLLFRLEGDEVIVVKIGHRQRFYEE